MCAAMRHLRGVALWDSDRCVSSEDTGWGWSRYSHFLCDGYLTLGDAMTSRKRSKAAHSFILGPDLSTARLSIDVDYAANHAGKRRGPRRMLSLTALTYLNHVPGACGTHGYRYLDMSQKHMAEHTMPWHH